MREGIDKLRADEEAAGKEPPDPKPDPTHEPETEPELTVAEAIEPVEEELPPAAPEPPTKKKILWPKAPKPAAEKPVMARQEVLQFEPVTRGRFEKSEPTIVEGQDLDVPTYLRKNVRVK